MLSTELLQQRRKELQLSYDVLSEKIRLFRRHVAIESDISTKFKLEKELEQAELERESIQQELEHIEKELIAQSRDDSKIFPLVFHNLPQPDYECFIGREDELTRIRKLLAPKSRHFVITIDGIGGIGKSALALEIADSYRRNCHNLPREERFDAIVWTTAKQAMLKGEGIITRSQAFHTLEDIYTTIAVTLKCDNIPRASEKEQDNLVRQVLTQQRTLLIVDNLETVDDERVLSFIREVPQPTKVIVTTRHRIDVAYPIRLVAMPESEALQLVDDAARLKDVSLTVDEKHLFCQRTGGVPLAIVWSIAQMGFGYSVSTVLKKLGQPTGDIAKFCFESALEPIKEKSAYTLLLALSLFATDASREALGHITDLSELDRDEGLVELEKLSLINKRNARFSLLPLTLTYIKTELEKATNIETLLKSKWIEYFLNFVPTRNMNLYEALDNVKPELKNILTVMDWCWHTNKLETFFVLVEKVEFYLWIFGRWESRAKYLKLGLEAADSCGADLVKADFLKFLAATGRDQGDLNEARNFIQQAINIYQLHVEHNKLVRSLRWLAAIQTSSEEYEEARRTLDKAWRIAEKTDKRENILKIQRQLAELDMQQGDYNAAETRLNQAKELLKEKTEASLSEVSLNKVQIYRSLGKVLLLKQDYESAKQFFQQSLEIAQKIDIEHLDAAKAKKGLAELQLILGNFEQAKQLANEAIEIFTKLGAELDIKETQALLVRHKSLQ